MKIKKYGLIVAMCALPISFSLADDDIFQTCTIIVNVDPTKIEEHESNMKKFKRNFSENKVSTQKSYNSTKKVLEETIRLSVSGLMCDESISSIATDIFAGTVTKNLEFLEKVEWDTIVNKLKAERIGMSGQVYTNGCMYEYKVDPKNIPIKKFNDLEAAMAKFIKNEYPIFEINSGVKSQYNGSDLMPYHIIHIKTNEALPCDEFHEEVVSDPGIVDLVEIFTVSYGDYAEENTPQE
jgi:hypothetical protein